MPIERDDDGVTATKVTEGDGVRDKVVDDEGNTAAGGGKPTHENERRQP